MAWYAVSEYEGVAQLVVSWPRAIGSQAVVLYEVQDGGSQGLRRIGWFAERLSGVMWERYAAGEFDAERATETVQRRLTDPGDGDDDWHDHPGYEDPVEQQAAAVGAALIRFGDPGLSDVMAEEVATEVDAVRRAERGDLTGRAEQAVRMDRVEAVPTQVGAAHEVMYGSVMQVSRHTDLLALEPAAGCVALVVWCHAAATLYSVVTGEEPVGAVDAAAGHDYHFDAEIVRAVVRWTDERVAPELVVTRLADSIRPSRLLGRLVRAYWTICRAVELTVVVSNDATPLFGGTDPLPEPEGETWASFRDTDPDGYDMEVRYTAQVETRHRVAALVDVAPNPGDR